MELFAKIFNYLGSENASEIRSLQVENIILLFRYRIIGMLNISGVHALVNFQGYFFFMKVNVFFFEGLQLQNFLIMFLFSLIHLYLLMGKVTPIVNNRSRCPEVFCKNGEACNFIKKRLWHRFFPVNFEKFLKTPFLQKTSGGCFFDNSL